MKINDSLHDINIQMIKNIQGKIRRKQDEQQEIKEILCGDYIEKMQKVKKKIDEGSLMRKKIIEKYEKDREESENILKLIKVDIVSQISKVAQCRKKYKLIRENLQWKKNTFVKKKIRQSNIRKYLQTLESLKKMTSYIRTIKSEDEIEYYKDKFKLSPIYFGSPFLSKTLIQLIQSRINHQRIIEISKQSNINAFLYYYIEDGKQTKLSTLCQKYIRLKQYVQYPNPTYIDKICQQLLLNFINKNIATITEHEFQKSNSILQSSPSTTNFLSIVKKQLRKKQSDKVKNFILQLQNGFDEYKMKEILNMLGKYKNILKKTNQFTDVIYKASLRHLLLPLMIADIEKVSCINKKYTLIRLFHKSPSLYHKIFCEKQYQVQASINNLQSLQLPQQIYEYNEKYGGIVLYLGNKLSQIQSTKYLWTVLISEKLKKSEMKNISFMSEQIKQQHQKFREYKLSLLQLEEMSKQKITQWKFQKIYALLLSLNFRISEFLNLQKVSIKIKIHRQWVKIIQSSFQLYFQ